jgi:hypothetical protein
MAACRLPVLEALDGLDALPQLPVGRLKRNIAENLSQQWLHKWLLWDVPSNYLGDDLAIGKSLSEGFPPSLAHSRMVYFSTSPCLR